MRDWLYIGKDLSVAGRCAGEKFKRKFMSEGSFLFKEGHEVIC